VFPSRWMQDGKGKGSVLSLLSVLFVVLSRCCPSLCWHLCGNGGQDRVTRQRNRPGEAPSRSALSRDSSRPFGGRLWLGTHDSRDYSLCLSNPSGRGHPRCPNPTKNLIQRRGGAPAAVLLSRFDIFRRMWEDSSECALGAIALERAIATELPAPAQFSSMALHF
jgi:hypothetical protein